MLGIFHVMPTYALKMIGLANFHPHHTKCICEKVKDCVGWHILGMKIEQKIQIQKINKIIDFHG
jgi:hypothetical protein